MSLALSSYMENSRRVRLLIGFHDSCRKNLTAIIDISDILRAAHVMIVSALDSYVHDVVRTALMRIYDGRRPSVAGYQKFRISIASFQGHNEIATARDNVEAEIRSQHSYATFQHPDKIADAIRLVCDLKIWEEAAIGLGLSSKSIKERLSLIVDRRNKIAHEADIDPTYGTLWPIYSQDVIGTVDFIDEIVTEIDRIVKI
jgi:hypothetical protein